MMGDFMVVGIMGEEGVNCSTSPCVCYECARGFEFCEISKRKSVIGS